MMGRAKTSGRSFAPNSIVLALVSEMIPKAKVLMQIAVKNHARAQKICLINMVVLLSLLHV